MPRFDSQRVTVLGRIASIVIACLSAGANDSYGVIVVIDDVATWATVTPSFDGSGSDGDVSAALNGTVSASLPGLFSTATFEYLVGDNSATFSMFFSHARDTSSYYQTDTTVVMSFMSAVDAKYTLSGNFSNLAGRAAFFGSLSTVDGIDLFYHYQNSDAAADFHLGVPQSPLDELTGSLTGILTAGQSYLFGVSATTDSGSPDSHGTAAGSMLLTIVPVPEPASGLYLLSGLFVAAFVWLRSAGPSAQSV